MSDHEITRATAQYPANAVEQALTRISAQGLWLLFSFDQYGWRAEYDAMKTLLAEGERSGGHAKQHAPLLALGQLFALVDKLWRLIYGIRLHRAGGEFLDATSGYLAGGYKLNTKLKQLAEITPEEWRELLAVPSDDEIQEHLKAAGASAEEVAVRRRYASELPTLIATNMREILRFFDQEDTTTGPRAKTASLRELDDRYRHGTPVVYDDCSPTDVGWISVRHRPGDERSDTVGVIMTPPDANGAAFIPLFKHDAEMNDGLLAAAETLAALVHRLTRAYLYVLAPELSEPLASVADYGA